MLLDIDLSKDMALILRIILVLSTCLCNDITFRHPNPNHKPSETTVKHDSTITGFASRYVPATHKVSMWTLPSYGKRINDTPPRCGCRCSTYTYLYAV